MSPLAGSWTAIRRIGRVLSALARHGGRLVIDRLRAGASGAERLATGPQRLRLLIEDLGGTYVKFGQILALQPDILPREYCDALLELLDRVAPFPYEEAERILETDLGRPVDELFDSLETEPLATASIGQVHVGRVDGGKVAVKVRRPAVEADFVFDVRVMETFVRLVDRLRIRPLTWLVEPTREFVEWTREELDFRHEARYSRALARQARGNPVQVVAEVLPEYTRRRTLVTHFVDGLPLLDYLRAHELGDEVRLERLRRTGFDEATFAGNIIDNFLGDVFRHGVYHADLHPANLLILPDNAVGYVDFGIIGVMSAYSRRHLVAMTLAVALGDIESMTREYLHVTEHGPGSDYRGLRDGLARLAEGWYSDGPGGRRLSANFTVVMLEMLQLSRQTRIMPERDIVKYIRSAIAIDGLIQRFTVRFDLGEHLATSCARLVLGEAFAGRISGHHLLDLWNAAHRLLEDGGAQLLRTLEAEAGRSRQHGERGRGA